MKLSSKGKSERSIVACVKLWHEEEAYNTSERLQKLAASAESAALSQGMTTWWRSNKIRGADTYVVLALVTLLPYHEGEKTKSLMN